MRAGFTTKHTPAPWMLKVKAKHEIRMVANVPHAAAIHEGRKPGARGPSAEMLKEWSRRVLGDEDAAYPVARAIHARGFNPAFHSGNKSAKFFWKPLQAGHPKWLEYFAKNVPSQGPETVLTLLAGEWESEARFVLGAGSGKSGRWFYQGTLSNAIRPLIDQGGSDVFRL